MKEKSAEEFERLFANYNNIAKWSFMDPNITESYMIQVKTICNVFNRAPEGVKIMEAGPGAGFTANILRHLGFEITLLDGQSDNSPDILCDVKDFKGHDYLERFDLICSFQILEHIPYESALKVLEQFKLATKRYVFISVPHYVETYRLDVSFPKRQWGKSKFRNRIIGKMNNGIHLKYIKKFRSSKDRVYSKEVQERFPFAMHYWEIGRAGKTIETVTNDIEKLGYKVVRDFPNEKFHYHHYFLLEKIV